MLHCDVSHLPSKDLQEFSNTIELFGFIDELVKDVVDGFPDKGTQT
jgi:hypothetical protein